MSLILYPVIYFCILASLKFVNTDREHVLLQIQFKLELNL